MISHYLFTLNFFFLSLTILFLYYNFQKMRLEVKYSRALHQRAEVFRKLVNATSDGMIRTRFDGQFELINDAGARIVGFKNALDLYLSGHEALDFYQNPEDRKQVIETIKNGGHLQHKRLRAKRINGEVFWSEVNFHPYYDDAGKIVGVEGLFLDVTDTVRMEEQLKIYSEKLAEKVEEKSRQILHLEAEKVNQEKLAAVGQTASALVHELRNPLSSIKMGLTTLLRRTPLSDSDRHMVEIATREVSQLEQIMRDILEFSRPGRSDFIICRFNDIVSMAIEQVTEKFRQKELSIIKDLDDQIPDIPLDRNKLVQVFVNLLLNAWAALEEGGRVVISTQFDESTQTIEATFIDNGRGLTPQAADRVFEPFYSNSPGGTGLGLTIVQKYVNIHGGTVTLASEEGLGTTVFVTIPVESIPKQPV